MVDHGDAQPPTASIARLLAILSGAAIDELIVGYYVRIQFAGVATRDPYVAWTLHCSDGIEARLSSGSVLRAGLDAGKSAVVGELIRLQEAGSAVERVVVQPDGALSIGFSDGTVIVAIAEGEGLNDVRWRIALDAALRGVEVFHRADGTTGAVGIDRVVAL